MKKPNVIKIQVDGTQADAFVKEILTSSDVFHTSRCGYWMRGIERSPAGRLVFEHADSHPEDEEAAIDAWSAGKALPPGYHALTPENVRKAWIEGVKRWGVKWFHERDAEAWDVVLQTVLFGEVKYG